MPTSVVVLAVIVGLLGGFVAKVQLSYKRGSAEPAAIDSLLDDTDVSPVNCRYVEIRGKFVDFASPFCFAHNFVLQDDTGILPCIAKTPLSVESVFFSITEAHGYLDEEVEVKGWYRRHSSPHLEVESFRVVRTHKLRTFDYRDGWTTILFVLMGLILSCIGGILYAF
jgi:hypothetical protein